MPVDIRPFRPADRGGVAAALFRRLLEHASAHGLSALYLGATEKFVAAHRFCEKHGFEVIADSALPPTFPRMAVDTRFYKLAL